MKEDVKDAVAHSAAKAMKVGMAVDELKVGRSRKAGLHQKSKALAQARVLATGGQRTDRVIDYLGGKDVIAHDIRTPLDTHHVISLGLPKFAVTHLIDSLVVAHDKAVLSGALGMSPRTQQRLKSEPEEALSVEVSGKAWQFAETLAHASEVFGTQEAAEHWLETPAIALEGAKPIDLLSTPPGSEMVRTLLTRIEFGVYA